MTAEIQVLQRLRVYEEPNGSYAVDDTANVATNSVDVPFVMGSIKRTLGQEFFDPKVGSTLLEYHSKKVAGRNLPTLAFDVALHSHGVAIDGSNTLPTTTTWALLRVLKAIFGAFTTPTNGGARTVQAGSTTTVVNVTAGRGADFAAGKAIAVRVTGQAAGTYEYREIDSVTANTITVKKAFSAAPVTGGTVYGAVTVYSIDDPLTSLQFVLEGLESDDKLAFYGMQGTPKFSLPTNGDIPKLSLDLKGSRWARLSSGSTGVATLTGGDHFGSVFHELLVGNPGDTTRVPVDQSAETWEPGIEYDMVRGNAPTNNNVLRMKRKVTRPPCKGSFTTLWEDTTWEAARAAGTDKRVDIQIGNTVGAGSGVQGGGVLICQRKVQIVDVKEATHEAGIGGQQVMHESRIADTTQSALLTSCNVMHFF